MSLVTFAPIDCKRIVRITDEILVGVLSSSIKEDSCGDINTPSNYRVEFYPVDFFESVKRRFLFNVFINETIIFTATANFSAATSELTSPYLSNMNNNHVGNITGKKDQNDEFTIIGKINLEGLNIINNITNSQKFSFDYKINPFPKITYFVTNIELSSNTQSSYDITTNRTLLNSINKKLINSNINVFIEVQTDKIGLNLGEMYCRIDSDKLYPNGYPQKYRGVCVGFEQPKNTKIKPTFYSFRPNIQKVLKLEGNVLYEQTKNINKKYNTGLNDCEFYSSILAYSTLRYIFAGLSNNSIFSTKWLCSNNYIKFLRNLKDSEFSEAIVLFTEPQEEFDFTDFNKYYKKCKCKK